MPSMPLRLHAWSLLLLAVGVTSMQLPKFQDEGTSNFQGELILDLAVDPEEAVVHRTASEPSTCVITRITTQDLPYVQSFLRHYARLGVNTIYLFNADLLEEKSANIVQYLQAVTLAPSTKVKLMGFKEVNHDDPIGTKELVPLLKENYVLNVDLDEFWVLPQNISNLPTLLREHPADIYFMRWVMVVQDELYSHPFSTYDGTVGYPGKWMANLSQIEREPHKRPFGHHTVPLREEYTNPVVFGDFTYGLPIDITTKSFLGRPLPAAGPFVPGHMGHLWGRSFADVFLKLALRSEGDCRPLSEYITQFDERLATLAFLSLNKKEEMSLVTYEDMFEPDADLETALAHKAACEKDEATAIASLMQYHKNYLALKQNMHQLMQQGSYPDFWPTTALSMSLFGTSVIDWLHSLPLNITS